MNVSDTSFPCISPEVDRQFLASAPLRQLCGKYELLGAMIVSIGSDTDQSLVVSGYGIPIEAFNGANKTAVKDVLDDCFSKHPKEHVHNVGNFALAKVAKRMSHWEEGTQRIAFVPRLFGLKKFVFIGFLSPKHGKFVFHDGFLQDVENAIGTVKVILSECELERTAESTQKFVREVGHDFASNVQAIIAKARNLREGRIPESAVPKKLREIESEIMAAHGLADQLGLTVDPNYQLRSYEEFDLLDTIHMAIEQVAAEAQERKLTIQKSLGEGCVQFGGDKLAIQTCWMHLLLNAIKYSYGGGIISIALRRDGEDVQAQIKNRGHSLPTGDDRSRIWDFGYRGDNAKELHVNGSGVGLFTVKKIVLGHRGRVAASVAGSGETVFHVVLPTWKKLKRELGFLI
jgi:signal transduction histidine kinase